MKFRNRLAATIAAGAILASSVLAGAAQSSKTAEVVISGGSLTAQVVQYDFNDTTFSFDQRVIPGKYRIEVRDLRGTYAGWSIGVSDVTPMVGHYSGYLIPADNIRSTAAGFDQGKIAGTQGQNFTGSSSLVGPLKNARFTGFRSQPNPGGFGSTGEYFQKFDTTLTVPAGAPADYYYSTVTIDVVSGTAP